MIHGLIACGYIQSRETWLGKLGCKKHFTRDPTDLVDSHLGELA